MPVVNLEEKMDDTYKLGGECGLDHWGGFDGKQWKTQFRTAEAIGMCRWYYGKPGSNVARLRSSAPLLSPLSPSAASVLRPGVTPAFTSR